MLPTASSSPLNYPHNYYVKFEDCKLSDAKGTHDHLDCTAEYCHHHLTMYEDGSSDSDVDLDLSLSEIIDQSPTEICDTFRQEYGYDIPLSVEDWLRTGRNPPLEIVSLVDAVNLSFPAWRAEYPGHPESPKESARWRLDIFHIYLGVHFNHNPQLERDIKKIHERLQKDIEDALRSDVEFHLSADELDALFDSEDEGYAEDGMASSPSTYADFAELQDAVPLYPPIPRTPPPTHPSPQFRIIKPSDWMDYRDNLGGEEGYRSDEEGSGNGVAMIRHWTSKDVEMEITTCMEGLALSY